MNTRQSTDSQTSVTFERHHDINTTKTAYLDMKDFYEKISDGQGHVPPCHALLSQSPVQSRPVKKRPTSHSAFYSGERRHVSTSPGAGPGAGAATHRTSKGTSLDSAALKHSSTVRSRDTCWSTVETSSAVSDDATRQTHVTSTSQRDDTTRQTHVTNTSQHDDTSKSHHDDTSRQTHVTSTTHHDATLQTLRQHEPQTPGKPRPQGYVASHARLRPARLSEAEDDAGTEPTAQVTAPGADVTTTSPLLEVRDCGDHESVVLVALDCDA